MNTCAQCEETFSLWILYTMHLESHKPKVKPVIIASRKRNIVGIKEPVSDTQLEQIVKHVETKYVHAIIGLLFLCLFIMPNAHADMGLNYPIVSDSVNEYNAKAVASLLGITQMYDHPTQVPQGQMYVPVEYNRVGDPGAGEQDPNTSHNTSDIDYVPLSQLKGLSGQAGAQGMQGTQGSQGVKGDTGAKGEKGAAGKDGDDGNNRLNLNLGASVRWHDWKHINLTSGARYDVRHYGWQVDMVMLNVKLGKSHEERVIEDQNKRIEALERALATTFVIR